MEAISAGCSGQAGQEGVVGTWSQENRVSSISIRSKAGRGLGTGSRWVLAALTLAAILAPMAAAQGCPGPDILTRGAAAGMDPRWENKVVEPGPTQRRLVEIAFDMMPEPLCTAAERIAFINGMAEPTSAAQGWVTFSRPDLILICVAEGICQSEESMTFEGARKTLPPQFSDQQIRDAVAARQAEFIKRIVHEAAHTASYLVESRTSAKGRPDDSMWEGGARSMGARIVADLRLEGGFLSEWKRLHGSFIAVKAARNYVALSPDEPLPAIPESTMMKAGFMSSYGSENVYEDIAELASWSIVQPLFDRAPSGNPMDQGCRQAAATSSLGLDNAAFYTKMRLLLDMEFIDQAAFDRCLGGVERQTGHDTSGFHVFAKADHRRSATGKVQAIIGTDDTRVDEYAFAMGAAGSVSFGGKQLQANYALKIMLGPTLRRDVAEVSWPRGIYRLETGDEKTSFWISVPDNRSATVVSDGGFVLVESASNDYIRGSIHVPLFRRPFAPTPVPEWIPQVVPEGFNVTFVMKK